MPPSPEQPDSRRAADCVELQDLERKAIVEALHRTHGHKARAAALLGVTRFHLYGRLKRYGVDVSPD